MFLYKEESDKVLRAFFEVNRNLPKGMLEAVYEKALVYELRQLGLQVEEQKHLTVTYKGMPIGDYVADVVVDGKIILELKSMRSLLPEHKAQLINYLAITGYRVGYLLNFSGEREYCRLIK